MVRVFTKPVAAAIALDLAAVMTFIVVGRQSHQESTALVDIARTAAPFLIALVLGWMVAQVWMVPLRPMTGVVVSTVTLIAGMFTRRVLFNEGIAATFIVVTALFLVATIIGWRIIVFGLARFRTTPGTV